MITQVQSVVSKLQLNNFKWKISLGLALFSSLLTLFTCVIRDVRWIPALNRSLISFCFFSIIGYFLGVYWENFWKEYSPKETAEVIEPSTSRIDVATEDPELDQLLLQNPLQEAPSQFTPLTTEMFEQVSSPKTSE